MRLALVVQRYGLDVAGGAELHARYVAELLAARHDVTVLTTTARDYVTWRSEYEAGVDEVDGVAVRRFPVERERDLERFAELSKRAFATDHARTDEERWLEEQGPWAPELWRWLEAHAGDFDAIVGFSFRYETTRRAALVAPHKTLLVATAERDPAVDLELSRELFRAVRGFAFNTPEERAMLEAAAGRELAGEVVGIFSRVPQKTDAEGFRERYGVRRPYLLYVGRIDRNKGCDELFDWFAAWSFETAAPHDLLLVGKPVLAIPEHPRIRHLGFVSDQDKFDAIAGAAALLVPSPYESLSMVTLEAMSLGVPPLVNGRCDVLRGQVSRADAGLYYTSYEEFFEALTLLVRTPRLGAALGANGERFYRDGYDPGVIAAKLERLLATLGLPSPRSD